MKHARHRKQHSKLNSVQQDFLYLRDTTDDMLCLALPGAANRRSYRAVLEVSPINLALKAEEEQEAIIARYQTLLKALTYSLQVLVRNQRLDLAPYSERLLATPPGDMLRSPGWQALAQSLADLLQRIAAERTLIERHVYVIVPAPQQPTRTRRRDGFAGLLPGRRRTRQHRQEAEQAQVAQELSLRVESLGQHLAACGLSGHRLTTPELAQLAYACLTPERALAHPLTPEALAQVGRPFTHLRRRPMRGERNVEKETTEEERTEEERAPGTEMCAADPTLPPVPSPDLLPLVDLLAPECIEITPEAVRVGQEYTCGIALTTCPREVTFDGWLAPLFLHDEVMDIAFHYHPQDTATMKRQLQRHRAGHSSGRRFNQRQGRTDDPDALVAEEDISRLLDDLARHRERVLDLGCYILVRATDRTQLVQRWERLMAVLSLLSLDTGAHATTFEQGEAFHACLPEGRDALMRTQTLDSTTLATMFPFLSNSLSMPDGVFMGLTETHEPVLLNPWDNALENPHMFIGGVTGSGKSYLGKLLIERDLLIHAGRGDQCFVIDPDLEYQTLAEALGGIVVRLAPGAEQHLNPFDLLPPGCDLETYLHEARTGDRLAEKIQDLHAMLDIMLADAVSSSSSVSGGGVLTKREKGLLDRALYETYRKVGITGDLRSHDRQPPLVRDLYDILKSGVCGTDESDLAGRLFRFVSGSLSNLFADFTSVDLASQLVVWDIRDMRSELRPLAISLIADRIWTQALYQRSRPRSLYIDEAASLLEHPEGGHFLATLSRRARKRYLRIVTMTQNPEQFVQDTWGSVVAANAAIKVLKTQDATSAAAVADRFHLTKSEQQRLMTLGKHEALVLAGDKRVLITIEASQQEHALITTNPVERAAQVYLTTQHVERSQPIPEGWHAEMAPFVLPIEGAGEVDAAETTETTETSEIMGRTERTDRVNGEGEQASRFSVQKKRVMSHGPADNENTHD
ncbi:MAG TPA: DUF87 domain-containing protein [Ktedonobacteraceae bacterium]|nr:DUF87 domain-containing protein [Ktedonobacteraceae bacterium]